MPASPGHLTELLLAGIAFTILLGPLAVRAIERQLEVFFFAMGLVAAILAGELGRAVWYEVVVHPVPLAAVVLVAGLAFRLGRRQIDSAMSFLTSRLPLRAAVFVLVVTLGVLSSVISAMVAALVLVELITVLKLPGEAEVGVTVAACFAIGLGAALTPIGEPLATVAVAILGRDFWYLMRLLGPWVMVGIVLAGLAATRFSFETGGTTLASREEEDARAVVVRALKVYVFVGGLILLGHGFRPIIDRYLGGLHWVALYGINLSSAVLDNASLTAVELSPRMSEHQLRSALLSLLISGGMLIPGNIPNIIAAAKLRISSRAWARHGLPLGTVLLLLCLAGLVLIPTGD
jgi:predicted cation transporter